MGVETAILGAIGLGSAYKQRRDQKKAEKKQRALLAGASADVGNNADVQEEARRERAKKKNAVGRSDLILTSRGFSGDNYGKSGYTPAGQ